jgi:hypothetical protein
MVDKNRGQLLLLGGLAMAIVFLAVIPLSNSLVVTESAATSETVREIDRTANRQANIERDIRTLANRTDAVNNTDAFNASLQNYSLYRTQVSGQRSGVYVNASVNADASEREIDNSETFDQGAGPGNSGMDVVNGSTSISEFDITIADLNGGTNNPFTAIISNSSGAEWQIRAVPSGTDIAVEYNLSGDDTWTSACGAEPQHRIDIQSGACDNGDTFPTYSDDISGPYNISYIYGNKLADGSYNLTADGDFIDAAPDGLGVPYVDVVYNGPDVSYTRTISIDGEPQSASASTSPSPSLPDGTVFTGTSNGIRNITGNDTGFSTITTGPEPTGLGPASDIDSDGTIEVPYVDGSGNLRLVTGEGDETLLADSSNNIYQPKTRLAVGTWDGSEPSVFYANDSSAISRVEPGESPVLVANPADGANAVVGTGDIDGDNTDELVFADGSQTLRYLEDDGSTETLPAGGSGISLGSSVGIGSGAIADYDGDDSEEVAAVDGGNDLVIADASGSETIDTPSYTASGDEPQPTQSPVTAADVDGDGTDELVYVESRSGDGGDYIRYLDNIQSYDDPGDTIEINNLTDASGDRISGDPETGAT